MAVKAAQAALQLPDATHVTNAPPGTFFTLPLTPIAGARAALFFRRDHSQLQPSGRRECNMIVRTPLPLLSCVVL